MNPLVYNGIVVYESLLACSIEPRKVHKQSSSMSDTYHRRIQKKWNKRYGTVEKPTILQVGDKMFAHPIICQQLRREIPEFNTFGY